MPSKQAISLLLLIAFLLNNVKVEALSQEERLSPYFCDYKEPLGIFETSITGLADLYEYLVPSSDDGSDSELNLRKSEVSISSCLSLFNFKFLL